MDIDHPAFGINASLMGAAAVAPALPLINDAFPDVPESIISMIITLPSLAVTFTAIFVGMAIDRFGKVPIFVISLLLFTIAGVSGYFSLTQFRQFFWEESSSALVWAEY